MDKRVVLKEGREKSLQKKHPWIFSGAISSSPQHEHGEILPVHASNGDFLALAYFHPKNSLAGRVLSFSKEPIDQILEKKIQAAHLLRKRFFDGAVTNAFRLINAEADGLPGLIVDVYNDLFVIQISSYGMERLRPLILKILISSFHPRSIYEKSTSSSRLQEGLKAEEGFLFGDEVKEVEVLENGLKFLVSLTEGQKTGFFLDQREMRQKIAKFTKDKRVLNCFSYTGGFSLFALHGGASYVESVDICKKASALCERNTLLNNFSLNKHKIVQGDVFEYLKSSALDFDIVICDPPAFAKKRDDIAIACKGYKDLNRSLFSKMPKNSLLLTSSCSYFIDEDLFQNLLFQAALEANRNVRIINKHIQAEDHPVSLYHPEGSYLKSFLLYVE